MINWRKCQINCVYSFSRVKRQTAKVCSSETDLSDNTVLGHRDDKMSETLVSNSSVEPFIISDNISDNNTYGKYNGIILTAQDFVLVLLYSITTFLAIVGNSLAIVIFTKGRKSKTDLRPFLINLAIADLIMAIFCIPFTFTYQLFDSNWVFSAPMCPIVMFLQTVSVTGSVSTNMAIGIDRLCAILFPLNASRTNQSRYRLIIVVIWIVSIGFAGVLLHVGETEYNPLTQHTECVENWTSPDLEMFYTVLVMILTYIVPVIILSVTYSIVGYLLWKRHLPGNADAFRDKAQLKAKVKIVKMLVTIVVLFVLCWLPLHTFFLVLNFTEQLDHKSLSLPYFVCHWIAMSNSFVNPIVYGTLNDSFRDDLKQLIFRCNPVRRRSGTTRHGAMKLKYPAEKYKLTYTSHNCHAAVTCTTSNLRQPSFNSNNDSSNIPLQGIQSNEVS